MKYRFKLAEYAETLEELDEEYGGIYDELSPYEIIRENDIQLFTYPLRIVIPDLEISIRVGMGYYGDDDEDYYPALFLYDAEETNPENYQEYALEAELLSFVSMYAYDSDFSEEEIEDMECYIDDEEFEA